MKALPQQLHHSATAPALIGGGSNPRPGEVSLAHHGVLFLDELPEFERRTLDMLREPLETGTVSIARSRFSVRFPACFQLVAAMNPCPCGYLGDKSGRCRCTEEQVLRYQHKISGPLMDRIDMVIEVNSIPNAIINQTKDDNAESSTVIRQRVIDAYDKQLQRCGTINAQLTTNHIEQPVSYTHLTLPTKA